MAPLQSVFCARTTQPKVTPTNHHLLIDIHHRRFSLGHQGLPRLHQSLENHLQAQNKRDMVKEATTDWVAAVTVEVDKPEEAPMLHRTLEGSGISPVLIGGASTSRDGNVDVRS